MKGSKVNIIGQSSRSRCHVEKLMQKLLVRPRVRRSSFYCFVHVITRQQKNAVHKHDRQRFVGAKQDVRHIASG